MDRVRGNASGSGARSVPSSSPASAGGSPSNRDDGPAVPRRADREGPCPSCGKLVRRGMKFCTRCGTPLTPPMPRSDSADAARAKTPSPVSSGASSPAHPSLKDWVKLSASGPLPSMSGSKKAGGPSPPSRPPKTHMEMQLRARRALSMGPTADVDPMTEEFHLQLLDKSTDSAKNTGAQQAPRSTTERALPHVVEPAAERLGKDAIFTENGVDLAALKLHLQREGRLELEAAMEIVKKATFVLGKEPVLLNIKSPCHVVGDIHGQYYDLIALLDRFDTGIEPLLFLGDYVDRGYFGCEVVLYLFALKLAAPKRYYFLRGNHECRALTELYNFKKECTWKYGAALYAEIMLAFDALPLACVVTNQLNERFFCVHGGISPYLMSLDEDVAVIDRFCEIPTDGPICDMVWSDPSRKADDESQEDWLEQRWNQNHKRKISWTFGWGVLESFLAENKLETMIRAHEVKQEGYEEMWYSHTQSSRKYPPLVTVFSAPNYCDMYQNKSSFVTIGAREGITYQQLHWADHPFCLPNFQNAVQFSLPFLITHMSSMIIGLLKQVRADLDTPAQSKVDAQISKMEKWHTLSRHVREERQALFQELRWLSEAGSPEEMFRRVLEMDASIEMLSPKTDKKTRDIARRKSTYF